MNKVEMLAKMGELGACDEAKEFVSASKKRTAKSIGLSCDRVDWLCWFLFRIRPDLAPIFARECANRAKGYAAAEAADWADCAAWAAGAASAADRAAAAWAAEAADWADCAARAARAAEAAEAADRKLQLESLHKMWAEVM